MAGVAHDGPNVVAGLFHHVSGVGMPEAVASESVGASITTGLALFSMPAFGQGNGKLQIHYMDVGQGDGAVLISPKGQVVFFDNGVWGKCDKPMSYLSGLGIAQIDYVIISHYHADHFGCTKEVLQQYPLKNFSYNRPGSYNSPQFTAYVKAGGSKRKSVTNTATITLDGDTGNPVKIKIAAYNGAGVQTDNENDRSVVAVVHFGNFDAMMAGDLSGYNLNEYQDVETTVSQKVGQVEVYKINHHGSRYSSNPTWLSKIKPRIAIISAGDGNSYRHPTTVCLSRLHSAGVEKTYWTERGAEAVPQAGVDIVANSAIILQVAPAATEFTVTTELT